jgi:hypothetical protein
MMASTPSSSSSSFSTAATTTTTDSADSVCESHNQSAESTATTSTVTATAATCTTSISTSTSSVSVMDRQLDQLMVYYLVDNLQPLIMTRKKRTLANFEEYYFSQYPKLTHDMLHTIFAGKEDHKDGRGGRGGRGQGRGLLATVGATSWKTRHLKSSSRQALDLVLRMLDPTQHPRMSLCHYVII